VKRPIETARSSAVDLAATHAIASATIASIFFDAFSLVIRQRRGLSTVTVESACCLNSSLE
jgi:hypothetical protein